MINPELDGVTHINVYSKGRTELGRLLSNFAHTPFDCEDGHFESVEGYWYWLKAEPIPEREMLRELYGFDAKDLGRLLVDDENERYIPDFQKRILRAIWNKIHAHQNIQDLLVESVLPLEHYYVNNGWVVEAGGRWILDGIEKIRKHLQEKCQQQP